MSTAGRTSEIVPTASDVAAGLRDAAFVRVIARADGDTLAAAGLLARALGERDVPFQVSVARTDAEVRRRLGADSDDCSVVLGATAGGADQQIAGTSRSVSGTIAEVIRELGVKPDPVLALAGAFSAGVLPGADDTADVLSAAEDDGLVARRPGVASPTDDVRDGLAHSTLVHATFSGDETLADEAVSGVDADPDAPGDEDHRRFGSLVALRAIGDTQANDRSAVAIERMLRPYATPDAPFATVGGYADVLDAVAREQPGTGVALALDQSVRESALDAWREHAREAHAAVRDATTGRYDGLFVARVSGDADGADVDPDAAGDPPVETVARLVSDYRSPEPVTLVVGDQQAAATAWGADDVASALASAVDAVGGEAGGVGSRGYARFSCDTREFITAFREARR